MGGEYSIFQLYFIVTCPWVQWNTLFCIHPGKIMQRTSPRHTRVSPCFGTDQATEVHQTFLSIACTWQQSHITPPLGLPFVLAFQSPPSPTQSCWVTLQWSSSLSNSLSRSMKVLLVLRQRSPFSDDPPGSPMTLHAPWMALLTL